jgi:hypothetical protein
MVAMGYDATKEVEGAIKGTGKAIVNDLEAFTTLGHANLGLAVIVRFVAFFLLFWIATGFDHVNAYLDLMLFFRSASGTIPVSWVVGHINATHPIYETHSLCAPNDGGDCKVMRDTFWTVWAIILAGIACAIGFLAERNVASAKGYKHASAGSKVKGYAYWLIFEFVWRHVEVACLLAAAIMSMLKCQQVNTPTNYPYYAAAAVFSIGAVLAMIVRFVNHGKNGKDVGALVNAGPAGVYSAVSGPTSFT